MQKGDRLNCKNCDVEYTARTKVNVYCSQACRDATILISSKLHRKVSPIAVFMRDDFKCLYCGQSSIEDGVRLSVDHVIPTVKGGANTMANLITCCIPCNVAKHDKTFSESVLERVYKAIEERNKKIVADYIIERKSA